MVVAQSQIYTLSPIDEWRVYQKGVPRKYWDKYTSTSYDFDKWITINDEDFKRVAKYVGHGWDPLFIGNRSPFYFRESVFSGPRENCFVYLVDGSLVTFVSEEEDYNVNPESTHFREEKLLDHINIILHSERIEDLAKRLDLPLTMKLAA